MWRMTEDRNGPKLLELILPGKDARTEYTLICKAFHVGQNRFFGTPNIRLLKSGKTDAFHFTTKAAFNLYDNLDDRNQNDFGLTVSLYEQRR